MTDRTSQGPKHRASEPLDIWPMVAGGLVALVAGYLGFALRGLIDWMLS